MSKYDISGASYIDWMEEKANQYNALIRQAERTRRLLGAPSKEEGQLYIEAAKVCQEIRDKNLSQRSIYSKWELRGIEATSMAREIANKVAPAPPPKPDPVPVSEPVTKQPTAPKKPAPAPDTASGQPQVQTTPSGFTTKNAIKEVPAETIEKWYKSKPNHGFDDVIGMEDLQ
ncbi:MAG: hypothetical protein LUH16_06605, partial [Clostridiales bacterium]|nr:hypothetical protein [Clostridiales bacterium]